MKETWFSIDVETSGSVPGLYDLVSIGACRIFPDSAPNKCARCDYNLPGDASRCIVTSQEIYTTHLWGEKLRQTFYGEIAPHGGLWDPEAEAVHGLSQEHLKEHGKDAALVIRSFIGWVGHVTGKTRPVFASWGSFDWMWMGYYLEKFGKRYTYPFGPNSLELKSYYMGLTKNQEWRSTTKKHMPKDDLRKPTNAHNALSDALAQAEMVEGWLEKYGSGDDGDEGCCGPRSPSPQINYNRPPTLREKMVQ